MDNVIQFPEGYRYDSDIKLFQAAVNRAKDMLENGELVILYQFIHVISAEVFISQDEFELKYDGIGWNDFINILDDEIIYLLRQNFEEPIGGEAELKRYLKEKDVSEECQEKIIELKLDKCKYVNQYLGGEWERNRYSLKNRSLLKKLSNIDYELSRTIDEKDVLYATIRMSVDSALEGKDMPGSMRDVFGLDNKEDITFICDKSDVEYLIQKLERIKQML